MPISTTSARPAQQLMSADDALARILAGVPGLPAVDVPLLDALGLVLAEEISADPDVPPFRNSAMDGYPGRGEDGPTAPSRPPTVGRGAGMGMSAAVGRSRGHSRKRPGVGVFSAGDETGEVDAPLGKGQIRASKRYPRASATRPGGGEPWVRGIVRDSPDALRAA